MGWDNPPISWREFERRLSWRSGDAPAGPEDEQAAEDLVGAKDLAGVEDLARGEGLAGDG